jgi:hypothetical protein
MSSQLYTTTKEKPMAEEQKKAKKPEGSLENIKVAKGAEKAPDSKSEVSGHMSPGGWYVCWNCGTVNWVPFGWDYFYCRHDVVLNRC